MCGDQNDDGEVNIQDVIIDLQIIVEIVASNPAQRVLSDLNRDGTIYVFDTIMALQHIVDIIPTLDECGPPT